MKPVALCDEPSAQLGQRQLSNRTGWMPTPRSQQLPVRGAIFLLTSPFIEQLTLGSVRHIRLFLRTSARVSVGVPPRISSEQFTAKTTNWMTERHFTASELAKSWESLSRNYSEFISKRARRPQNRKYTSTLRVSPFYIPLALLTDTATSPLTKSLVLLPRTP
jgi:hypothetical protein